MSFAIKADEVTVNFASGRALDAVSLTLGQGEFVAIVGPNGSGKTTLLRVLAANLRPQSGVVYLAGRDLHSWKAGEVARQLATVPQRLTLDFAFTVREVVAMGRYPYRSGLLRTDRGGEAAIETALTATGLTAFAGRLVTELSGGEWQRVVIAQALAQEPRILLLDEPTAHLDLSNQVQLLELLRRLNQAHGLTVCAVLHDLNLAARYCDRVVVLAGGKVRAAGTPGEVFTPGLLRKVFRAELSVERDAATGRPIILPKAAPPDERGDEDSAAAEARTGADSEAELPPLAGRTVHVICGGGSGGQLLRQLTATGAVVTAGALNRLDTDWETARSLGLRVAEEAPFSHLGAEVLAETRGLIKAADLVILASLPFGPGNLVNLRVGLEALTQGKPVIACDYAPVSQRDFTGGEAADLYERLLSGGGRRVGNPAEMIAALRRILTDGAGTPTTSTGKEEPL